MNELDIEGLSINFVVVQGPPHAANSFARVVSVKDLAPVIDNIAAGTTVRWQLFVYDSVKNPITLDQSHQEKGFNNFFAVYEQDGDRTDLPKINVDDNNLYYYFDQTLTKAG